MENSVAVISSAAHGMIQSVSTGSSQKQKLQERTKRKKKKEKKTLRAELRLEMRTAAPNDVTCPLKAFPT